MIQEAALEISKELGNIEFKASNGWVEKFLARHDITIRKLTGESASADINGAKSFVESFETVYSKYDNVDIFNCDETGLFYKLLPNKSYVNKKETGHGIKSDVRRISILFCCSSLGEKLNPLFIGHSKRPRPLSQVDFNKAGILYE
jgi:hypothetical protein